MSINYNRRDALLNHFALLLMTSGLALFLLKILSEVLQRLQGVGPFGAHLESSAEGNRLLTYAGVIFAGGAIYSMDRLGKILGTVIALFILCQLGQWFYNYHDFNVRDFWQVLDVSIMAFFFLTFSVLLFYLPYCLAIRPKPIGDDYHLPRQNKLVSRS